MKMGHLGELWNVAEPIKSIKVPESCEETLLEEILNQIDTGIEDEKAEERFQERIGAYVIGKLNDVRVFFPKHEITTDTVLKYAPQLTAVLELAQIHYDECGGEKGFFIKAVIMANSAGYVTDDLQITEEGRKVSEIAIRKEAAYS